MDADRANRDRIRVKIAEMWRPLPRRERTVYVLAVLLFVLAFLGQELMDHILALWVGDGTLNLRLPQIESLLLTACFPVFGATFVLAMRRWRPEEWHVFRRLWSARAILVGLSVMVAFFVYDSVIGLATPADQIPPYLPSFLAVPFIAAASLVFVGMVIAAPEAIVRMERAKRRQVEADDL